ncbi:MAG TPA: peptidase M61, partial [Acidobacteriaceae bacterium]
MMRSACLVLVSSAAFTCCALAQSKPQSQPQPVPMPPPIVAPIDKPYVGPIDLTVDLTNIVDRVEKVHEDIPVEAGSNEMVLLYPQWLPGDHEPSG